MGRPLDVYWGSLWWELYAVISCLRGLEAFVKMQSVEFCGFPLCLQKNYVFNFLTVVQCYCMFVSVCCTKNNIKTTSKQNTKRQSKVNRNPMSIIHVYLPVSFPVYQWFPSRVFAQFFAGFRSHETAPLSCNRTGERSWLYLSNFYLFLLKKMW